MGMPAMAEAVSWQAGAMSWVLRKASSGRAGLEVGRGWCRWHDGRGGFDGEIEEAEESRSQSPVLRSTRPVWVAWVYSATRRRAEPVEDVFGHGDPGGVGVDASLDAAGSARSW
jgi:hypothetical protein